MSNTKKIVKTTSNFMPRAPEPVNHFMEREFAFRGQESSDSDSAHQARRIDHLEKVVSRLIDVLVQSDKVSAKQLLWIVDDGYYGYEKIELIDQENE